MVRSNARFDESHFPASRSHAYFAVSFPRSHIVCRDPSSEDLDLVGLFRVMLGSMSYEAVYTHDTRRRAGGGHNA